jgi:hypothetical protein
MATPRNTEGLLRFENFELEIRAGKLPKDELKIVCPNSLFVSLHACSRGEPRGGRKARFSPSLVVQVKALACELPHRKGLPLSRFWIADIRQEVLDRGLVAEISEALFGAGSAKTPSVLGGIEAGSFPVIHCLWKRPVLSSISTKVCGKDNLLVPRILCSPPTRRLGFKRVTASILPSRPPREERLSSSTSTSAKKPGSTSRLGMSAAPKSSAGALSRMASNPSIA